MNKAIGLSILLVGAIIAALSSCSTMLSSANSPTPDWQPLPTYINDFPTSETTKYSHYIPSAKFDFHLEFDYPSYWLLTEYTNEIGMPSIFLHDPRILALPTPVDTHPTPNDYGSIAIWIMSSQPGQTIDSELESHKKDYNETSWMKVLDDYKTTIDGHAARVLEYQIQPLEYYTSVMFAKRTYFMINNRVCEIIYEVAEKDRGAEFDQGYEYFFKSLKIMP